MKKIFICTDGTWNTLLNSDSDELAPTNVAKIARAILTNEKQLVYYNRGIGTGNILDKYTGGLFGQGLFTHVKQSYSFLVNNYRPNDQLLIFGFSRGAYVARSLSGLINKIGILRKKYISDIDSAYNLYRNRFIGKTGLFS